MDYFLQLFGIPEERKNGVYTAELAKSFRFNYIYLLICFYKISFGPEIMKVIISQFQAQGKPRSDLILIKR